MQVKDVTPDPCQTVNLRGLFSLRLNILQFETIWAA
jgi:hypothetical protein